MVEAEKLAAGNDWRGGVNRFRALLDQWKALPRLDRTTDDELWHRFSTRPDHLHPAPQGPVRRAERAARIGPGDQGAAGRRGRGAGELHRLGTDDRRVPGPDEPVEGGRAGAARGRRGPLEAVPRRPGHLLRGQAGRRWTPRTPSSRANAEAKEKLLVEGEALLPITDLAAAKAAYRDLLERWSAIGKVPRDSIRPLENRLKAIETAIRQAEEDTLAAQQSRGPRPRRGDGGQARGADRHPGGEGRQGRRPAVIERRRPGGDGIGRDLSRVARPGPQRGLGVQRLIGAGMWAACGSLLLSAASAFL